MKALTTASWFAAAALFLQVGCTSLEADPVDDEGKSDLLGADGGSEIPADDNLLPFEVQNNAWRFISDSAMRCMDGSESGFAIRYNPNSSKLLVHMQAGGSCFNGISCQAVANINGFDEDDFWALPSIHSGILDSRDSENPFHDYSHLFLPYCSGDVFAGNAEEGFEGRVQVGAQNTVQALARVEKELGDSIDRVVLSGSSAGGLGVLYNYESAKTIFDDRLVGLVSDSAPILDDETLSPCLQDSLTSTWNMRVQPAPESQTLSGLAYQGLAAIYAYLSESYPEDHFGVLASTEDSVFRFFYSMGIPCRSAGIDTEDFDFESGAYRLRNHLETLSNFDPYFIDSSAHTYLGDEVSFSWNVFNWLTRFESKLSGPTFE